MLVSYVFPEFIDNYRLPFPIEDVKCQGCRRMLCRSFVTNSLCGDCKEIDRVFGRRSRLRWLMGFISKSDFKTVLIDIELVWIKAIFKYIYALANEMLRRNYRNTYKVHSKFITQVFFHFFSQTLLCKLQNNKKYVLEKLWYTNETLLECFIGVY